MAVAAFSHNSAPRSKMARAVEWVRGEVHGEVPAEPTPQEPSTQLFKLDDEDSVPELRGTRPDRLVDVRPQTRLGRHGGIGYELMLSTAVPQGALEEEIVAPGFLRSMLEDEVEEKDQRKAGHKMKRKMRKRRKKKTPKTHSSSSLLHRGNSRSGAGDQGFMHEYEFEYVQRADVPRNIHTVLTEPLNSVHCSEVLGTWTRSSS